MQAVAWITQDGVGDLTPDFLGAGFGRVMLTRYTVVTDRDGTGIGLIGEGSNVVRLTGIGPDTVARGALISANDNVVWVGDETGTGTGGVFGRDPQAVALVNGDTIVTWVGTDGSLNGKAYSGRVEEIGTNEAADTAAPTSVLTELLQGITTLAPDQRYRVIETGRDSFAILWAATLAGAVVLQGRQFSAPDEQASDWHVSEARSVTVGPGFNIATDLQVLGWSEESGVVTVSYEIEGGGGPAVRSLAFDVATSEPEPASATAPTATETSQASGSSSSFGISLHAVAPPGDAASGASAIGAAPAPGAIASLHSGIVDVAGSGGQVLIGDAFVEQDGVAGFSAGDAVEQKNDEIVGTQADDVIVGDLPDLEDDGRGPIEGGDDVLSAEAGDDVIYGGGGDDAIDGGQSPAGAAASVDTAVFTGDARDYSITANGDGSYTVVHAASDTGTEIDRSADGFEGVDTVDNIEQYQFLNGDVGYLVEIVNGADIATLDTSGHGVVLASDLYQIPERAPDDSSDAYDGTPTAWGLTRDADGNVENVIEVVSISPESTSSSDAPASADEVGEAITIEAPLATETSDGGFAVAYVLGEELIVSTFDALGRQDDAATCIAPVDTATSPVIDAAGDGVAVAYVTTAEETTIGVEIVGGGDATTENASASIAVEGDVGGLAIAGADDGSVVNVAWVETAEGSGEHSGDIVVQRLEASTGDGSTLIEAGLDGEAGAGSDSAETIGAGRAPAITETENDGFAVAWVDEGGSQDAPSEQIEGRVFDSAGVVVETFTLPVGENRHLREGSGPTLETTGDGDLFVAWEEVDEDAGGLAIMSALLRQLGPSDWASPIIRELYKIDGEPSEVSIAVAGENGDAIIVTWRNDGDGGGEIVGQRFSVDAIAEGQEDIAVGLEFAIAGADDSGNSRDNVSVAGLDDGRVVVVSREIGESADQPGITVQATLLDTRNPDDILISENQGAAQDTHVGTIGDDIVDGRASSDEMHGALGNDVLTGGTGNDRLDGGEDHDTLLGGSGSDHLDGGDGDDLLMGGFGRDYIYGGKGEDTLSYRGEARSVAVDLATGIVRSDAAHNAVSAPSQNLDVRGISESTFFDSGVEDILGRLETTNRGSDGGVEFHAGHGIENVEGGTGADILLGDSGDNVLTGGKGDDVLDGRGGRDTAAFAGNAADYDVGVLSDGSVTIHHARNVSAVADDGTDTLRNIETIKFADGKFELLSDGTLTPASIATAFGIVSEISVAAVECFDFTDLDHLDDDDGDNDEGRSDNSGSSDCDWRNSDEAPDLYGLGSDTLYFGDLDKLCPSLASSTKYDDLDDLDDLDYGSCTLLASAEIDAALCLDGPDTLDAMTTIDTYLSKPEDCDPTEFRIG